MKIKSPSEWEWPWLVWVFCQPPGGGMEQRCIRVRCWRPWIYDGLCMYHNHLSYRVGG